VRLPLVVIDPMNVPSRDIVSVGSTNFRGGRAAAQHLVDLGHRHIAYLGGRETAECSPGAPGRLPLRARDGKHQAAGEVRAQHPGLPLRGRPPRGTPAAETRARPTAIFAASDELARGAIEAARTSASPCPTTSVSSASMTPKSPASPHRP
jgi:LacI family transcriptional regulator